MHRQAIAPDIRAATWPVHPMIAAAPIVCFAGALLTDAAYAVTAQIMWSDFSDWLLAFGMALGVLAFVIAVINVLRSRAVRGRRQVWPLALGGLVTLAVAFINNLVHSRDAWTSVVPVGLALSVLTIVLILVTGWLAAAADRRHAIQPVEIR